MEYSDTVPLVQPGHQNHALHLDTGHTLGRSRLPQAEEILIPIPFWFSWLGCLTLVDVCQDGGSARGVGTGRGIAITDG